jgi:hypothetical protein
MYEGCKTTALRERETEMPGIPETSYLFTIILHVQLAKGVYRIYITRLFSEKQGVLRSEKHLERTE